MSAPTAKQVAEEEAERLLAAAKLNPNDGGPFRSLGHHYARAGDAQRAARCYQRAVTLDPDDAEAGEALCDLLDVEGKESLELAVCKEAAGKSPRAFWAFRRLGYLQVHQNKWSEAIQSLQHSIRGYPTCADLWEALGLAYHRLGMFTAAVKSYGRAIELDSSRVFALIESGNIQLMLGYFRKGVEQFRSALELAPHNHSAYFGLASALLAWSRHCVATGAFTWAANLLKEASEAAKVCSSLTGNLSCVWKLHADTQLALARCFPWEDGDIKWGMDEHTFKASVLEWRSTCLSAANGAKLSYQRALHLTPWEANIHIDTAVCLDLICTMEKNNSVDLIIWELPEKMSLGGLMLEPVNKDFWVTLGSVSSNQSLKQHSLIRALHLDMSLSEAWAYLGKIYRQSGHKQLARQAFDRARSIDPSLALPWAGMSAEDHNQYEAGAVNESYESCLRAVQILPLPEFQIGLGTIAARSGELLSPQVLMAVRQAVQRAPHYPESHNINGLVAEVRSDFQSAIASYQQAKFALDMMHRSKLDNRYPFVDVSLNLARSLFKAGLATDAARECEELKTKGLLNVDGLQIYAFALWKLGRHDEALSVSRNLAENLPSMKQESATGALGFICTLAYNITGTDSAALVIHTLPGQPSYNRELKFIISALDALQPNKRFQLPQLSMPPRLTSYEVMSEVHSNIALGKAIGGESNSCLGVEGGLSYLKKVLHMYPDCSLVRNHLGSLLLSGGDWTASHKAVRVTSLSHGHTSNRGLRSPHQIQACATVSCYATCISYPKFSFPTCEDQYLSQYNALCNLQRLVHQEPWNQDARYLLVLAIFQKAREEKYPKHISTILKSSRKQYMKCLQNRTNTEIGWVMLKQLESRCSLNPGSDEIEINLKECIERKGSNPSKWVSLFNLACAQSSMRAEDFAIAEKALAQACAEKDADSCVLFLNGAMNMEMARRYAAPQFITLAASSLRKAQQKSQATVPVVSLLLAQADGSLGSKAKWEKNLRLEWFSWPPELRPAELYFQMHLLASQSTAVGAPQQKQQFLLPETMQSPGAWLLRAIHQNPSCSRYWKALQQLVYV
ncbi:hypothetical protein ACQ4PT_034890 [Festuca glaucescens]